VMVYLFDFEMILEMAMRQVEGSRNETALDSLFLKLGQVQLLNEPNSWRWSLDDDGVFSVHVNIFFWRISLDMLPTRLNLSLRGLDIPSIVCPMCNNAVDPWTMSSLAMIFLRMLGTLLEDGPI
nr:RNA-directed DNA polymerase, eukaryota [Tanacetum cinerariifolium]